VWAFDIVHCQMVFVFPTILGLLGDNPMQSELACHIGIQGKFFCCVCWVKGKDSNGVDDIDGDSDGAALSESSAGSATKGRRKVVETIGQMVDQVKQFIHVRNIFINFDFFT